MQSRTLEGIRCLLPGVARRAASRSRSAGSVFAVRERLQHASGPDAERSDEAGYLDVRFLEQRLQPFWSGVRDCGSPDMRRIGARALLGVGTKLRVKFLRDQTFHQPLRIGKSFLRPRSSIRLRLGEMERAREPARRHDPATGSPVLLRLPTPPPVLRRRFHDDFLDLALDQPVGQATQVERRRADLLALEASPSTSTSADHDAPSIFLWTSIPAIRYGIGLSSWERRACLLASLRVASYRRRRQGRDDAQFFGQSRTLRITQLLGLQLHGWFDLAPPTALWLASIFIPSRAAGPSTGAIVSAATNSRQRSPREMATVSGPG
jgi:hypothetical protein